MTGYFLFHEAFDRELARHVYHLGLDSCPGNNRGAKPLETKAPKCATKQLLRRLPHLERPVLQHYPTPVPVLLVQGYCTAYLPGDLLGVCGNRKNAEMLSSASPGFSKVSPIISRGSDIGLV